MFDKHKRESLLLRDLLKKLIIIVIGSIVAAYGITLALYAGFGGATLAVLWQGIAETFHLSIGMASFVVAVGMILFALIYDKSQIQINPSNSGQNSRISFVRFSRISIPLVPPMVKMIILRSFVPCSL